jgi:hypothetical protein
MYSSIPLFFYAFASNKCYEICMLNLLTRLAERATIPTSETRRAHT